MGPLGCTSSRRLFAFLKGIRVTVAKEWLLPGLPQDAKLPQQLRGDAITLKVTSIRLFAVFLSFQKSRQQC
jgi:hypothetical protein